MPSPVPDSASIADSNGHVGRSSLLLLGIVGPLSLWDFYIGEIKVFDFLGLALGVLALGALFLARSDAGLRLDRGTMLVTSTLFVLILAYCIVGIAGHPDNLKPAVGVLLGVCVLICVALLPLDLRSLEKCIRLIAYVHLGAFFLQLAYYLATRQVLNFHSYFGLQPRLLSSVFRPAGLFLEPAIYCFFAASLYLLRRQHAIPHTRLDMLMLISMVLSLSLWGVAMAYVLFALFRPRMAFVTTSIAALVLTVFIQVAAYEQSPVYKLFEMRLSNLGGDASAQGRFGGTLGLLGEALTNPTMVFGDGINNFFEEHGSNGLSFILNSMGIIGASILIFLCLLLAVPGRWMLFLIALCIALTAAPLWKTFYFWAWIGLMLKSLPGFALQGRRLAQA